MLKGKINRGYVANVEATLGNRLTKLFSYASSNLLAIATSSMK